jgi:hypothetical protein
MELSNFEESVSQLIRSIAEEEASIARLIEAEASKIHAFIGENLDFPSCPTSKDILRFTQSSNRLIETVLMKEWLLMRKIDSINQIYPCSEKKDCTDEDYFFDEDEE